MEKHIYTHQANTSSPLHEPISPIIINHLQELLACVPPARLKNDLYQVFMIFLKHERSSLPDNFNQLVYDYFQLFRFLDKVEESIATKRE